jgi:hypothetical protein
MPNRNSDSESTMFDAVAAGSSASMRFVRTRKFANIARNKIVRYPTPAMSAARRREMSAMTLDTDPP